MEPMTGKHQGRICLVRSALLPLGHLPGGNLSNLQHSLCLFPYGAILRIKSTSLWKEFKRGTWNLVNLKTTGLTKMAGVKTEG